MDEEDRESCRRYLERSLWIGRCDPVERERRTAAKEELVRWILDRLDEPVDLDGTSGTVPAESERFCSYFWPIVRECVLIRDDYTCAVCGVKGWDRRSLVWSAQMDVHHIRERQDGGDHSPRNLVTLCNTCHKRLHRRHLAYKDFRQEVTLDDFVHDGENGFENSSERKEVGYGKE